MVSPHHLHIQQHATQSDEKPMYRISCSGTFHPSHHRLFFHPFALFLLSFLLSFCPFVLVNTLLTQPTVRSTGNRKRGRNRWVSPSGYAITATIVFLCVRPVKSELITRKHWIPIKVILSFGFGVVIGVVVVIVTGTSEGISE
ncbi:hypothetical protein K474DRAFT_1483848 [Panus rudis PR-1116 ss-1]|nr:hypothetical protein K474DRAFT_1483848 [Panus rudis PR-1116 ss-1]